MEMNGLIDVRPVLPAISVPTLVVHATNDNTVPFLSGEYLAQHIPGARFLPIDSTHTSPFSRPRARSSIGSTTSRSSSQVCDQCALRIVCWRPFCIPTLSTRPLAPRRSATRRGSNSWIAMTGSSLERSTFIGAPR